MGRTIRSNSVVELLKANCAKGVEGDVERSASRIIHCDERRASDK